MSPRNMKLAEMTNSIWCKGRTNVERRLILLTLIILSIALALAVALAVVVHKAREDEQVCTTTGCIHAASEALKYMNLSVEPCEDFYEFACGNYLEETLIPEDKTEMGPFTSLSDTVRDQIKSIIEEPLPPRTKKSRKLLKQYYDLCMNTTAIEADGLKTIKGMLKDLGGWPLLEGEKWEQGEFDWKQSVYKFRKRGFSDSLLLMFNVGIDYENSTRRVITLDEPPLGLGREYLLKGIKEKLVKAYYDFMVDIAVMFGANRTAALKEMKDTLEFEIQLANITLPKEERRNFTLLYNPMTVEELQTRYTRINWLEYITNVLDIPDVYITYDEMVIVSVPKFINDLIELLERTPKRVQANYIMSRAALSVMFYLTQEIRDRQLEFYKIVTGRSERESRWKECTSIASGSVHLVSGSLYVQKYFKEESKKHTEEMVADIRAEFVKILKRVEWMDKTTRENALEKAASITTFIGYPDELLDEKKIDKYYTNLEIYPDSYLKSMKALSLFRAELNYKKLRKPVNKTDWIDHSFPAAVNAYYSSTENSIEFPAGILQGVFFGFDRPSYMNYGGIGYVIGHEITHGFDDGGSQFDKDGNLKNWWAENTKEAYDKKAQCIIEQYGNYTVPEVNLNLNGINTQGENIADNGGIKEAYLAYISWVERNGPEPKLPGLNYTPNQMFWVSAAHSWCHKERKEVTKITVTTGYHSPSRYRVVVPFSNTEYFSKDFKCPVGSPMNPVHKCSVW